MRVIREKSTFIFKSDNRVPDIYGGKVEDSQEAANLMTEQSSNRPNYECNAVTTHRASNGPLAFLLSLIGGILITIGAVVGNSLGFFVGPFGYGPFGGFMGGYGGMMGGYYYGSGYVGFGPAMMGGFYGGNPTYSNSGYAPAVAGFAIIGAVAGIIVLAAALYMRSRPVSDYKTLGALILVFSITGLVTVGGVFLIGGVLGVIGGILALLVK